MRRGQLRDLIHYVPDSFGCQAHNTSMNQPTPTEKYVFVFAKNEDGSDMKFRFMLVLGKQTNMKIGSGDETVGQRLMKAAGTLDGIDNVTPDLGRYTMELTIARTFDPDEVIAELKKRLDNDVLSEIVRPSIVT